MTPMLNMFCYLQAAYHSAKPAVLTQQLQQLKLAEDKVGESSGPQLTLSITRLLGCGVIILSVRWYI